MNAPNEKKSIKVFRTMRNYFEYFIVYCFIGWLYEVFFCMMLEQNQGFINRGFLFGPWLPIYGFGMLLVLFITRLVKAKTPFQIFLVGGVTATLAELAGSYVMEWMMGDFLWTYRGEFLNFQGRIALKPDLYFAILILFGIYYVHPRLVKFQEKYDRNVLHNLAALLIFLLFLSDFIARFYLGSNYIN